MVHLWRIPEKFLNRDMGEYDEDVSPNRFLLLDGKKVSNAGFSSIPIIKFEVSKNRLLKFDCLPNSSSIPLVNERVKALLQNLAPNEVQFFRARLSCKDGELENYYLLYVTHSISAIDHEKSIYTKMKQADAIAGFKYLMYKPDCMDEHHLARDKEYLNHLLVSEKVKRLFDKEKITGVMFVLPEEYFHPLTIHDLTGGEFDDVAEAEAEMEGSRGSFYYQIIIVLPEALYGDDEWLYELGNRLEAGLNGAAVDMHEIVDDEVILYLYSNEPEATFALAKNLLKNERSILDHAKAADRAIGDEEFINLWPE